MHHLRPFATLVLIAAILAPLPSIPGCGPSRVHSGRYKSSDGMAIYPYESPEELLAKIGLRFSDMMMTEVGAGSESAPVPKLTIIAMNPSPFPRDFFYRIVWFDRRGVPISGQTSQYIPKSPLGGEMATMESVAPSPDVGSFMLELTKG